jgi:hypothetical protein
MNVLIVDEGFMSGAFTALGLSRTGCKVDVLAAIGGHAECRTRSGQWCFGPRPGDPALASSFDPSQWDVVYAATEPLQTAFGHPVRPKSFTSAIVRSAGVSAPAESPATTDDITRRAVHELGLPIVIKGEFGRGGKATFIIRSEGGAIEAARRLRAASAQPFAQRYVAGPTFLVGGLFDRGRALRLYCGRKTVQFPADTGPAAEIVSVRDEALVRAALAAFEALNVSGLASADFIANPQGGYEFLEMNPRPWGSITAAGDAGVDLFAPLVALWRGDLVEADLRFGEGVRSTVFPLGLLTRAWPRALRAMVGGGATGRVDARLAVHIARRLTRVARHW